MKAIANFFLFALLLIVGCTPSNSFMFFDNRINKEYKVNIVKYKDGIVVNINDTRTVVARFSSGQKELSASGKYLGHLVELSAFYSTEYNPIADIGSWKVSITIDGELAGVNIEL
jgi:hypothetical protein